MSQLDSGAPAAPDVVAPEDDTPGPAPRALERALKLVTGFVAPTTLVTALAVYFGYVATDAFYEYYGVDAATVRFSTRDYLLRSVGALYLPIGLLVLVALLVTLAHPILVERLQRAARPQRVRWILGALSVAAAGLALAGLVLAVVPRRAGQASLAGPLCVAAGVLIAYAVQVLRGSLPGDATSRTSSGRFSTRAPVIAGLVAAIVVVATFWAANSYAVRWGRGQAEVLASDLRLRPAVVLDTKEPLFLSMPGVRETALPVWARDQQFRYRYRGLRLLAQSDQRMFLIPTDWTPMQGEVLMLADDGSIRMHFAPA